MTYLSFISRKIPFLVTKVLYIIEKYLIFKVSAIFNHLGFQFFFENCRKQVTRTGAESRAVSLTICLSDVFQSKSISFQQST